MLIPMYSSPHYGDPRKGHPYFWETLKSQHPLPQHKRTAARHLMCRREDPCCESPGRSLQAETERHVFLFHITCENVYIGLTAILTRKAATFRFGAATGYNSTLRAHETSSL